MDNPEPVKWRDQVKYETLDAFIESEDYTPELNLSIQRRAAEAVRKHSRQSMPFAMLIQGLVDFKGVLTIPAGTDLFDPDQQRRFILPVVDFSGALKDSLNAEQF